MKKTDNGTWEWLRGYTRDHGASPQDLEIFDEVSSRRQFFGQVGKGGAALALLGFGAGTEAALQGLFGRGMIPAAWANTGADITDEQARHMIADAGKEGLIVYNERPMNAETPPHLLADAVTPAKRHFIRNNDMISDRAMRKDPQGWKLEIEGEVHNTVSFSLDDLKGMRTVSYRVPIECGGNGRARFDPSPRGNQWKYGAIGNAEWTGVPLAELLKAAGLKDTAVYTAHYGEEPILGDRPRFSRGIPIEKAMEPHTLVAFQMNGHDIPAAHGYPVRLVVPGWVGSCSHKWLNKVVVRDREHDGRGMTGYSYRMPRYPVRPGDRPPEEDMVVATSWVVKSLITGPAEDSEFKVGETIKVTGHAWAGENDVKEMWVSTDFGLNWNKAKLGSPHNKYSWQQWETDLKFDGKGYYEIWARAVDDEGNTQPIIEGWNPRGYLGHKVHRVPVVIQA
ncbi:sulfite oxidase [Thioalkalivibrio thiocyanodenitrificans]|uniref:sulfite oxidase n=1 Tax=Thioalkalivibrio thiocyanodenitrificans TaxID=243063 RepID=UPI0003646477|nr:sulfite oxidase [Thioalkalivibrio thiocyanodenitrificans]